MICGQTNGTRMTRKKRMTTDFFFLDRSTKEQKTNVLHGLMAEWVPTLGEMALSEEGGAKGNERLRHKGRTFSY